MSNRTVGLFTAVATGWMISLAPLDAQQQQAQQRQQQHDLINKDIAPCTKLENVRHTQRLIGLPAQVIEPKRTSDGWPGTAGGGAVGSVDLQLAQAAPIANGTYTTVQADRGKIVYEKNCSTCHGPSLRGGANEFAAPALAGPFFFEKWSGRPLEELYRYSAENMPPGEARLRDTAYLDVTAYILEVLKYPAGTTELTADSPVMKRGIERQQ